MRKLLLLLYVSAVLMAASLQVLAVVRYVPHGGTPNYPTIQAAINASFTADIVRVQPGIYQESIRFRNVDITLTSTNPSDPNVVQSTIIQGDGTNSVVTFGIGQRTNTVFTGFTVRGGGGTYFSGAYFGGGLYCFQSSPTIVGNIIEENHPNFTNAFSLGGAISCWDANPRVARNIIRRNSADIGGAIVSFFGKPLIHDNWIYTNLAITGAAAYLSDQGRFFNNTLWENIPDNLYVETSGLIVNNIIANSGSAIGITVAGSMGNFSWLKNNDIWEPDGTEVQLLNAIGTNAPGPISLAGIEGNISVEPLFVNSTNFDLHLSAASPCINAGDLLGLRSTNEIDFDGGPRIHALRVDLGATEFRGIRDFPPIAYAGADQTHFGTQGGAITLDGAASVDPEGTPLNFTWLQTAGAPVSLSVSNAQAFFTPPGLGDYHFQLVVNDGVNASPPDAVRIVVTNLVPIASAGIGQSIPAVPEVLALDGSHSLDPEGESLMYQWLQVGGPPVALSSSQSQRPSFAPAGAGKYEFELTVSDSFHASLPDRVTFYLGHVPPVANAGPIRYAGRTSVSLDGSGSFAPNTNAPLSYAWKQISGAPLTLSSTNIAKPVVSGFVQTSNVLEFVFELIVSAGGLGSAPSTVKVILVPAWNNALISQVNGAFNTNRPSVLAFGGGNCDTGSAMSFPGSWITRANLFTVSYSRDFTSPTSDPRYFGYGDQLMVLLSQQAPGYDQPIQTVGYSTGCMTACDVAERMNVLYRDPRYLVNRISLLDSGCGRDYSANISNLSSNRMPGRMFWIDNYYSVAGRFRAGTLNVQFPVPPADHGTPSTWFFPSWNIGTAYSTNTFNNGVFGGAFFSLVGPGKNYQLETAQSQYHFGWSSQSPASFPPASLIQMDPIFYPTRLPGVVELIGPANAALASGTNATFSCKHVLNAVRYQILVGPDARRLDRIAWEGSTPPTQPLSKLPFAKTWWTLRAVDAFGTMSWADPRHVLRDSDGDTLTDEAETVTHHTNPDNADTDGDGHLDGQELIAGTNPLQPNPGFALLYQLVSLGQLRLRWYSDGGNSYDLEFSSILTPPSWQHIQTFVAPANGGLMERMIVPSEPAGFYRVRSYTTPGN